MVIEFHELPIPACLLGESPVWDKVRQGFFWADLSKPRIHFWSLTLKQHSSWDMPQTIGCIALTSDNRILVAFRHSFYIFNPDTEKLQFFSQPQAPENPHIRMNDGKVAPDGSLLVGSMDEKTLSQPVGKLYRLLGDGSCRVIKSGLIVSNGLAFTRDGSHVIHSDSRKMEIYQYRYQQGQLLAAKVFNNQCNEAEGRPDGGAMDLNDRYWSAGVSAACLNLYAANGELIHKIKTPCQFPTMIAFGGATMQIGLLTSLQKTQDHVRQNTKDGKIFSFAVDMPGVPVHPFKLT